MGLQTEILASLDHWRWRSTNYLIKNLNRNKNCINVKTRYLYKFGYLERRSFNGTKMYYWRLRKGVRRPGRK